MNTAAIIHHLRRFVLVPLVLGLASAWLYAAPLAVTDLRVDVAGYRHVTLSWTTPADTEAAGAPSYYELRLSTYTPLVTGADWDRNSAWASYPYRIAWSTSGVAPGAADVRTVTGLDNGQTYFFALKSSTDTLSWSAIDTASPEPFAVPFNSVPGYVGGYNLTGGVIVTTTTPALWWDVPSAGSDDDAYGDYIVSFTVELSPYADFSTKTEKNGLATTTWISTPLQENTTYYWRVKGWDTGTLASPYLSQAKTFVVNAANESPGGFNLTAPVNNPILNTSLPNFQWTASQDPDPGDTLTYTVFYSTRSDFAAVCTTATSGITTLQHTPDNNLIENATYFWRVHAVDPGGKYAQSGSTGVFRIDEFTDQPPLPFNLVSPVGFEKVRCSTPTLSWQAASDPDPDDTLTYTLIYSSVNAGLPPGSDFFDGIAALQYAMPALEENATYWWKVQAHDRDNNTSESGTGAFIVDAINNPPLPFNLVASSGVLASAAPLFQWQASTHPEDKPFSYVLYYSTAPDFSVLLSSAGLLSPTYTPQTNLDENTTYYWRVAAQDDEGGYTLSLQTWTIIIDAVAEPPLAFSLIAPADGATETGLTPTLSWESATDPDPGDYVAGFTLFYSTCSDFNVQASVAGLSGTSYTFTSALSNNVTYYWRVQAAAAVSGQTLSGQSRRFLAANLPPERFDLAFSSGVIRSSTVSLGWAAAADPEGDGVTYTLIYSTAADFSVSSSSSGLVTCSATLEGLEENKTYFWCAEALDFWGNKRTSSQAWSFSVDAVAEPPAAFSLVSPENNASLNTNLPKLQWQDAADPDPENTVSYTLWYSTDATFSDKTILAGLASPWYYVATPLLLDVTYYWKVHAVGSCGMQMPSAAWQFIVNSNTRPEAPSRFRSSVDTAAKRVTLSWDAVVRNGDGTSLTNLAGYLVYKAYDFDSVFSVSSAAVISPAVRAWTEEYTEGQSVYYLVRAWTTDGLPGSPSAVQKIGDENATLFYSVDKTILLSATDEVVFSTFTIDITRIPADESGATVRSYRIEARDVNGAAPRSSFAGPVTLTFKLPAGYEAPRASSLSLPSLGVFWHNGVEWVYLGGERNLQGIAVKTPYTGRYQLRTVLRSPEFRTLTAWPKVITPNGDGINDEFNYTFENPLAERVDGTVFDLSGSTVAKMKFKTDTWLFWDGKDESGQTVSPGVYIYQARCGTKTYNGTVVVAR